MAATTTDSSARVGDDRRRHVARRTFTEAKNGFKTSEFYAMLVAVAGILYATYVPDDSISGSDGWRYAAWVVVAYIVSRGLAKLGTREPYTDHDDD